MDSQTTAALEVLRVAHNLGVCARLGIPTDSTDTVASAAFAAALAADGRNVPRGHTETIYATVAEFLPPTVEVLVVASRTQIIDAIGRALVADPARLGAVLTAAGIRTSL